MIDQELKARAEQMIETLTGGPHFGYSRKGVPLVVGGPSVKDYAAAQIIKELLEAYGKT